MSERNFLSRREKRPLLLSNTTRRRSVFNAPDIFQVRAHVVADGADHLFPLDFRFKLKWSCWEIFPQFNGLILKINEHNSKKKKNKCIYYKLSQKFYVKLYFHIWQTTVKSSFLSVVVSTCCFADADLFIPSFLVSFIK